MHYSKACFLALRTWCPWTVALVVMIATPPERLAAQSLPSARSAETDAAVPVSPAVVLRGADGHVTVRATRIAEPLVVDGHLDEAVYAQT